MSKAQSKALACLKWLAVVSATSRLPHRVLINENQLTRSMETIVVNENSEQPQRTCSTACGQVVAPRNSGKDAQSWTFLEHS